MLVMPIEPKGSEILERVKQTFAVRGFEGASMQELARAAGMSAGNFYRYFPSKNALVEAIIEREIDAAREEFARVLASEHPLTTLCDLARYRIESDDTSCAMWAEIEAAAGRRPEIAALMDRMATEIQGNLVAVFARLAQIAPAAAAERYGAHARFIMMLFKGLSLPGSASAEPDRALGRIVIAVIERLLTEIAGEADAGPLLKKA